jgi:hypothetical protein
MRMNYGTRREFLLRGSAALTGMAAASRLFAQTHSDPLQAGEDTSGNAINAPGRLRGLMVDAGRVPESLDYYKRVIEFCADWDLNALQFRVADDQGAALRFSSVPDLLFHQNAFTPDQLRALAQFARSHGVDLIPELESFGHTGYITRSAAYAHLLDNASQNSEFTGVIPVHPETLALFRKLYAEITSIFPSTFLHGGCDEVNWGGSALSRSALQTMSRSQIWAEYLNSLSHIAEGLGKQFIVWGDFVLHKEPTILGRLSKTIIVMDWNYQETSTEKVQQTLSTIHANGSRALGAPGLISYKWGPRAGTDQLANIDAFADAYFAVENSNSLGSILTNWVPSRYIQNSIWDGFAYAAVAFREGKATARNSGFQRFVKHHYRADWNNVWDEAFRLIYDAAPQVIEPGTAPGAVPLLIPWSSDDQLAAVIKNRSPRSYPFTRLRSLLIQLEPQILNNLVDFQAFSLSVEYLEKLFWRETIVVESVTRPLTQNDADLAIRSIAERDLALAEALSRDWDQGRFPDSPARLKPLYGFQPKDQLLFQWERATRYSTSLATRPDRFYQILTASKPV